MSSLKTHIEMRLQDLKTAGIFRQPRTITTNADGTCEWNGRTLVNFAGNDYLNFAHDIVASERYRKAASKVVGSTASALVSGRSAWHAELEQHLAEFEQAEAALLFPTGYAANLGLLTGLVQKGDAVFCDRDNHASIIDASRQCDGDMLVFRRDRLDAFRQSLRCRRANYRHCFVVVDGVYSMDGTIPDLQQLAAICEELDCAFIVDEAHGTGVLGKCGRGACELSGVEHRTFARIGTMSKAMGGLGGFVVSDESTISLLRNTARTQFFSTALPPLICAAMLESLRLIKVEPERRRQLADLIEDAHAKCHRLGLKTTGSGPGAIVPIIVGDPVQTVKLSEQLSDEGWLMPAIRSPTVKPGTERLRLSLNVKLTKHQISAVLERISELSSDRAL